MRRLIVSQFVVGAALSFPFHVQAANCMSAITARHSVAFNNCVAAAHGTRQQLRCIGSEIQVQQAQEGLAFSKLLIQLGSINRQHIQRVEKIWLSYRDSWCSVHVSPLWGTLSAIGAATCRMDETIRHSISLDTFPRDAVVVECVPTDIMTDR